MTGGPCNVVHSASEPIRYARSESPTLYTTFQFPNLSTEPRRNTQPAPDALTEWVESVPPWPLVPAGCRPPPCSELEDRRLFLARLVCNIYGNLNFALQVFIENYCLAF